MKTVVGLYDEIESARRVVDDLVDAGVARDNISMVARDVEGRFRTQEADTDEVGEMAAGGALTGGVLGGLAGVLLGLGAFAIPGLGPVVAAGPIVAGLTGAGVGAVTGGLLGALIGWGIPEEEAEYYAEGVRRGGTLVAVRTTDEMADNVADIMNRHNPVDVEQRAASWRETGWTGFDVESEPTPTTDVQSRRDAYTTMDAGEETAIPVVEEELRVGKRQVDQGGVRVHTHVETEPVEEQVRLREERVTVQRHPVDRSAESTDLDAFEEGTIEVRAMAEEPVIQKLARVVEEVVIRKDVDTRVETVSDTVRRTEVDVDRMGTEAFNRYSDGFRTHYQANYGNTGRTYESYEPAYQYGYFLASDPRYQGYDWNRIEPAVRRHWETEHGGVWDDFKGAARHAWNEVKRAV